MNEELEVLERLVDTDASLPNGDFRSAILDAVAQVRRNFQELSEEFLPPNATAFGANGNVLLCEQIALREEGWL